MKIEKEIVYEESLGWTVVVVTTNVYGQNAFFFIDHPQPTFQLAAFKGKKLRLSLLRRFDL